MLNPRMILKLHTRDSLNAGTLEQAMDLNAGLEFGSDDLFQQASHKEHNLLLSFSPLFQFRLAR